ncbi:hypothetical protein MNEG_0827 [Monoraphidium neglectum]|uniref:Uncharacterized protein n=1 Tax=Monoraphidium neglectum TaxID=145388 RepID=A0A0D2KA27_9CHLO|nr:hypothetical protein MNEG_0827 [Monoraphidium neglectum]KIZ07123.1 hypothetical protein MNEG_0827 [Monoraphidium neglectum]|eukprot:XP_013906142.1 hypothetical protein MNEG_0827 [Monoraphidium neglectum]
MERLDDRIGPMLEQDGSHFSKRWGFLSRAGLNDKSQLCRQIEKYADVYTSRVSNFMRYTPYAYFRRAGSPSQSLAHDRGLTSYYERVLRGREDDEDEAANIGAARGRPGSGGAAAHGSANGGHAGVSPAASGSWSAALSEDQISDGGEAGTNSSSGSQEHPGEQPVTR